MFRIKICGITNVPDAVAAVDAGADAIGLNFYKESSRVVNIDEAQRITKEFGKRSISIGVFVNAERSTVESIRAHVGLLGVQFHGDEHVNDVAFFARNQLTQRFSGAPSEIQRYAMTQYPFVIRARRMDQNGVSAIRADLEACQEAGGLPGAVLVDAFTPGRYGGTGETVSWVGLADHRRWLGDTPLILAGGLTPDNVAEAIRIVRPHGVDVASGVESAPGKKDPHKVRDFIAAARAAFEALSPQ